VRPRESNFELPRCVYVRRGTYFYVKRGKWQRLGKTLEQVNANLPRAMLIASGTYDETVRRKLMDHLKRIWIAARVRAKKTGTPFDLTLDEVELLLVKSSMKCAITGHAFTFDRYGTTIKRPFVPSIDRIDSSLGYSRANCRIVCAITNIAMNAWGEKPLLSLVAAAADRDQKRKSAA
jgi:hypothetical protein